jgi:streptogramin lyase
MNGGVVCAAVVLVLVCAGCQQPSDPPQAATPVAATEAESSTTAIATSEPSAPPLVLPDVEELPSEKIYLKRKDGREPVVAPAALLDAAGSLWLQDHRGRAPHLTRIDPQSGQVISQTQTGRIGCGDLAYAGNAILWTGCNIAPGLVSIDVDTGEVTQRHNLCGLGPAVLEDEIWMPTQLRCEVPPSSLSRLPLTGLESGSVVPVPGLLDGDGGAVAVAGSIWVTDKRGAVVYKIDPDTQDVVAAVPMPLPPASAYLIEHDGAPWYYDAELGRLARIDPATLQVRLLDAKFEKPHHYWGVAASTALGGDGWLWVRSGDGEVWLLDTRGDTVLRRIAVDRWGGGGDVQQIGDTLWVSGFANQSIQRIHLSQ